MHRAAVQLAIVAILLIAPQTLFAQHGSTYLGCFSFPRLLYLKGVEGVKPTKHSKDTIGTCFSKCKERGYSQSIVATDFRCWCAISTPPAQAQTDESACEEGSTKGALVFFHFDGAQACRVQELEVDPSNFVITPQSAQGNVIFDAIGQTMALHLNSSGGARVTANFPPQLYGQLEVLARVSVHPAVVTSIDVQDASQGGSQGKGQASEDISWQFYNTTPQGIGKNILMGTATRAKSAASALDTLMKPGQYKGPSGLKLEENLGNTWVTYTIHWQADRVSWAMNGVPLLTKWRGSQVKTESGQSHVAARRLLSVDVSKQEQQQQQQQQQRKGQQRKHGKPAQGQKQQPQQQSQRQQWAPPDKPAQLSFDVRWNPKVTGQVPPTQVVHTAAVDAVPADGGKAMHSSFMEVKRIVCDKPRVRGDPGPVVASWFVLGPGWDRKQQLPALQQQKQQQKQQQQASVMVTGGGGTRGKHQHGYAGDREDEEYRDGSYQEDSGERDTSRGGNKHDRGSSDGQWDRSSTRHPKYCPDCPQRRPYRPDRDEADGTNDPAPRDEDWPLSGRYYKEDAEIWAEMEREEERDAYFRGYRDVSAGDGKWKWTYQDSDQDLPW